MSVRLKYNHSEPKRNMKSNSDRLGDFYKWTVGWVGCCVTHFEPCDWNKLVKIMKQVKMIQMLIMRLRSVSGSPENLT